MKVRTKLGITLGVAMLAAFAIAAPAQAITITPGNTAVSANSRNSQFQYGPFGVIRCVGTGSTFTGTTSNPADTRLSGRLTFGSAIRPSGCSAFGVEAFIVCSGSITIVADTADGRGGGTVRFNLDRDFQCSITVPGLGGCSITIRGEQRNLSRGTYVASSRTLRNDVRNIAATQDAVTRTALCGPASGASSFSGDYLVSTPANLSIT